MPGEPRACRTVDGGSRTSVSMLRSILLLALAVRLAAPAAAQATPETPGAAGAVAAAEAFVAAQRTRDWPMVLRLLASDAVDAMRARIPGLVTDARAVRADSAGAAAADAESMGGSSSFETARRVLAITDAARAPNDELAALMMVGATIGGEYNYDRNQMAEVLGAQLDGRLAHVVVRVREASFRSLVPGVVASALRWSGTRWQLTGTDQAVWFVDKPGIPGLARPDAFQDIVVEDAPPAVSAVAPLARTPLATAETPGPAGAEAAALALVAAQRAQDWTAALALMNPYDVSENGAWLRQTIESARTLVADSATIVASEEYRGAPDTGPYLFAFARRLGAALPGADSLADVPLMVRFVDAAIARNPNRLWSFYETPALAVIGSVAEGDSLVHVVCHAVPMSPYARDTGIGLISMRWSGSRWTLAYRGIDGPALDALASLTGNFGDLLGDIASSQEEIDRQYRYPGTLTADPVDDPDTDE